MTRPRRNSINHNTPPAFAGARSSSVAWIVACALLMTVTLACDSGPPAKPHATKSAATDGHSEHDGHNHGSAADTHGNSAATPQVGPDTSPVKIDMSLGWCNGHGVPESVCTRCNSALIAQFKAANDWCSDHGLPETQCELCNPGVKARWAALNPSAAPVANSTQVGPDTSPVKIDMSLGWCNGHGVPESVCTRCNSSLIAQFKAANDWCSDHGLPETQCELCNPGVKARWAALNPSAAPVANAHESTQPRTAPAGGIRVDLSDRVLTGANDPLCTVGNSVIRFVDATIAVKAGIETVPVERRRMSVSINLPAESQFDQTRVTHVTPRVGGVVREARVQIGDEVAVGDIIATLDSAELGEAKSRYIELRENLTLAQADFNRVQQIADGTATLLEVCTIDRPSSEIHAALEKVRVGESKSKLLRAHSALVLARANEERERQLREKNITSIQDYQTAVAALSAAEGEFFALREEIDFSTQRERLTVERAMQVARMSLEAAGRRLQILGLSSEQIAAIAAGQDESLSLYTLHSPATGRVIQRHMAVGETVDASEPLVTIADVSSMWLVMNANERDLPSLRVGQPVLYTIDGLPGRNFEGRVTWIASQLDERTRTVQLRANLANTEGRIRAGMFGTARVILAGAEPVISVPNTAVQTDGCCQLAFVRIDGDAFEPRKISLGAASNGYVEVLDGLAEGESVVTTGSYLMKTEILKGNIGAGCCEVEPGR